MTRYQKARWKLRYRNARYAINDVYGTVTLPIRKPSFWLMCRYSKVFFFLYYTCERPDLAFRFGRIWPENFANIVLALRASKKCGALPWAVL